MRSNDMKTDTKDDEILRQYLLGALNEGQADELERRLFAEEELFELAEAVEGDLLMAAARGDLSSAERGRVLRRLAASPEGRARLALIKGLTSLGREQASVPAEVLVFQLLARPGVRAAAVAATLAFVAGGSWLASRTAMPHGANMIARGLPAAPAPGIPRPAPAEPPVDRIAEQAPAPVPPVPPEDRAAPGREPSARPEPAPLILELALSVVRSGNDRSRLEIPPGAGQVEIRLRLDREEPYTIFSAILQSASTGEEIRREERIAAREVDGLRAIVFSVPSTELDPGFYQVEVHGIAPEGDEFLGRPMFEVVST
jgi:hypothetical protein